MPLLACTVERDLAIDHDSHEFVALRVLDLDDLMTAAGQLSPSARLLGVLLDCLVCMPINSKCCDSQPLTTCSPDGYGLTVHAYGCTRHQLSRDRL